MPTLRVVDFYCSILHFASAHLCTPLWCKLSRWRWTFEHLNICAMQINKMEMISKLEIISVPLHFWVNRFTSVQCSVQYMEWSNLRKYKARCPQFKNLDWAKKLIVFPYLRSPCIYSLDICFLCLAPYFALLCSVFILFGSVLFPRWSWEVDCSYISAQSFHLLSGHLFLVSLPRRKTFTICFFLSTAYNFQRIIMVHSWTASCCFRL